MFENFERITMSEVEAPLLAVGKAKPWLVHGIRHALAAIPGLLLLVIVLQRGTTRVDGIDRVIIKYANYVGDASFALTGSVAAGQEGLDLVGCLIVGFITATGGGTFRDLMLGRTPMFWLSAWDEALLSSVVCVATFFGWPRLARRFRWTTDGEFIFWTDTVGLGIFAANGALIGATFPAASLHFAAKGLCGAFTATFGGVARDVLLRVRLQRPFAFLSLAPRKSSFEPDRYRRGSSTRASSCTLRPRSRAVSRQRRGSAGGRCATRRRCSSGAG